MDNTNFTAAEGSTIKPSNMSDEHQIIKITERTPTVPHIGKIVQGDTNSNLLTFEINRYYEGVDLYDKSIKFIVKNEYGVFTEPAVNLQYNDTLLRFSWILSYAATTGGPVTAAIEFYGLTDSGENYSFKTTPFTIKIEESLDATDITILPPVNWFVDTENRLSDLEEILFADMELATKQDIADALSHMEYESVPIDFSEAF